MNDLQRQIEDAMWAGDVEKLDELAPCRCCCWEHTFGRGCPAYAWGGCRGQDSAEDPANDYEGWARHYERFHGMTRGEFDGNEG
jgi:hypothetical protein